MQDEGLRYVFALAGVWFFLAGLLAFPTLLARTALLLLTALFFFTPTQILRTVPLLTTLLLAHTTLLTIFFHCLSPFWTALSWVQP